MVSGLRTSPYDHARIISGEARPILIESKCSTGACCLKSLSRSFIDSPLRREASVLLEFDVDAERADFLDQHVEGLGHARLHLVIAIDNALVHRRASDRVVGLDRKHLLQRVCRAVSLQCPDFHLTEALAAELRLATQRLLCDQAVRT